MNNLFSNFFKDKSGELSSKRLIGISWGIGFLIGTPLLTAYLIYHQSYRDAVELWTSFGWSTMAILGVGVFENFSKNGNIKRSANKEEENLNEK